MENIPDLKSEEIIIPDRITNPINENISTSSTDSGSVNDINDEIPSTNDGGLTDNVLDTKMTSGPLVMSDIGGGRKEAGRKKSLMRFGDPLRTIESEKSVMKALQWLKEHQSANGSWSQSQPDAMCGLALLCYLAHGEMADSKLFGNTVSIAMQYLSKRMEDSKGKINGSHGYPHAIVTYALCESYGMTKLPYLRESMEKGLDTIINGQMDNGGFNYDYSNSGRWDLSFTGWNIQAMKAGLMAGSSNSKLTEALIKSAKFVKNETYMGGRFGYEKAGQENGNYHMTEVGVLCLQISGMHNSEEVKNALITLDKNVKMKWVDDRRMSTSLVSFEPYGWYYDTQARFYAGGTLWKEWDKVFSKELTKNQNQDGHWDAPPAKNGNNIGEMEPYYATTLCCLMLEVYYRFLPSFKIGETGRQDSNTLELE